MQQVKEATPFSLRRIFKYFKFKKNLKKFTKKIQTGSPSFSVLWNFADFIKYAENIFFYNNSKNSLLYSSTGYAPQENGFRINGEDYIITVKLFSEYQRVGIDIESKVGNRHKINYTFEEQQWTIEPDEYDEILIDRVIGIINHEMLRLLNDCIQLRFKDALT